MKRSKTSNTVTLGEICSIEKGKIGIQAAIPGKYPLVTTAEVRGSHNEFHFEGEAVCIPLVSATGHGHASIKRIHFQTGRFCVGNILCACIPKDYNKTSAKFLHLYFSMLKDVVLVPLMQGSANVSLKIKDLLQVEVPNISFKRQLQIVDEFERLEAINKMLVAELDSQQSYLQLLRQTILQEAVQGKLTKQSRKDEPASVLLKKINQERDRWFSKQTKLGNAEAKRIEAKLKKLIVQYPSEPLPSGWIWTSLSEACCLVVDCHNKTAPYSNSGIPIIRTSNIKNGKLTKTDLRFVSKEVYDRWSKRCPPEPGDIIFTREAPVGEAAIIPHGYKVCLGQRTMLFRTFNNLLIKEYLFIVIQSLDFLSRLQKNHIGSTVKHLRVGDVESAVIPLPPLAEQQRIVSKVQQLQQQLSELEAEVEQSREYAQQLLQAVLREAFEGKGKAKVYEMEEGVRMVAEGG